MDFSKLNLGDDTKDDDATTGSSGTNVGGGSEKDKVERAGSEPGKEVKQDVTVSQNTGELNKEHAGAIRDIINFKKSYERMENAIRDMYLIPPLPRDGYYDEQIETAEKAINQSYDMLYEKIEILRRGFMDASRDASVVESDLNHARFKLSYLPPVEKDNVPLVPAIGGTQQPDTAPSMVGQVGQQKHHAGSESKEATEQDATVSPTTGEHNRESAVAGSGKEGEQLNQDTDLTGAKEEQKIRSPLKRLKRSLDLVELLDSKKPKND